MLNDVNVRVRTHQLDEAVRQIKVGNKQAGKRLLSEILRREPKNERAWLWMSNVVTSPADRTRCLQQALKINPANPVARKFLNETQTDEPKITQARSRGNTKPPQRRRGLLSGDPIGYKPNSVKPGLFSSSPTSISTPQTSLLEQAKSFFQTASATTTNAAQANPYIDKFLTYIPHVRNWTETAIAVLFGLNLLYASIIGISDELRLRNEGLVTTGFVVSVDERTSLRFWDYFATYNYETQDGFLQSATTQISRSGWSSIEPGQPIQVLYVPDRREGQREVTRGTNRLYFGDSVLPLLRQVWQLMISFMLIAFGILLTVPYWFKKQKAQAAPTVFDFGNVQMKIDQR